jgi:hypothetical protein
MEAMVLHEQTGAGGFAGKKVSTYSVVERSTEAARQAIAHAREEALNRGGGVITVADLLAGLSYEEDTRAERMASLKTNAFYLRWLAGSQPLPALEPPVSTAISPVELDSEAKRALGFAVMEADRDREYWIDTDHLLRGLMRFANKAHFALLKTEFRLPAARLASRQDREEHLPEETPSLKVIQYLVRKHIAVWVPPVLSLACYLYILIQTVAPVISPVAR